MINIGAGSFHHPRWTNLDVSSDHYDASRSGDFIEYDITALDSLPFADSSVSLAYTSHTIEHVKEPQVDHLFREIRRTLRPDGVLRVTCPDAHVLYVAATTGNHDRYFDRMHAWFYRFGLGPDDVSPIDIISKGIATGIAPTPLIRESDPDLHVALTEALATMSEAAFLDHVCSHVEIVPARIARHVSWWTTPKVTAALESAGFTRIWPSSYGGSVAAPMCDTAHFDNTVPAESLYVEAMP